jgi:hypothetical protein
MLSQDRAQEQSLQLIAAQGDAWWQGLSRQMMGVLLVLLSAPFIAHAVFGLVRPGWLSRGRWVNHKVLAAMLGGVVSPRQPVWFELLGALVLFVAGLLLIVFS